MIITKSYEASISGKYQGRRFGTTLQVDTENVKDLMLLKGLSGMDPEDHNVSDVVQAAVVSIVSRDIDTAIEADEETRLVVSAAREELMKYRTYLQNIMKQKGA